jgi:hypothetical protein
VEIWIFDQIEMIGKFFDAILVLGKLRDRLELFIFEFMQNRLCK